MVFIRIAEQHQSTWKKTTARGNKTKAKQWCEEQIALNSDVLYFIFALIGSRQKCEPKSNMKALYQSCYTRLLEISASDFSALWLNSNYDMFMHYGNRLPDIVLTFLA